MPFWTEKALPELSNEEWESVCDGCARCCLHKLEDEDTGEVHYTQVACRLLDITACRCSDYANRQDHQPDCIGLTPHSISELDFLPPTCAYRKLAEGKDLAWWHPLISGDPATVHEAGISVRSWAFTEELLASPDDMEDYIIELAGD